MMVFRFIGMMTLLLTIAGCASLPGAHDAVRVTVSDIRVLESTLLEQLYEVTIRIQNRGEQDISIRGGSVDMEINGRDFAFGVTDQQVTVAAYSDARINVRMVSTLFGMLGLIRGLQEGTGVALEYEISGRFSLEDRFGGVAFRETGEVSLPNRAEPER